MKKKPYDPCGIHRREFIKCAMALPWLVNSTGADSPHENSTMKISRIEIFPARYPMTGHFKFFTGPHGSKGRAAIFVKITTSCGAVGWGQSVPIARWSYESLETATVALRDYYAPQLIGHDPTDITGAHPLLNPWAVYTLNRFHENTPPPQNPLFTTAPSRTVPKVPDTGVKSVGGPQEFVSLATPSDVKVHRIKGGFRFSEQEKDILVYQKDPIAREDGRYSRGHYVHPLYDLNGVLMSQDMPGDHPHHRGIFWAWPQLWIEDLRIGNPWEQRDLSWHVEHTRILGDASSSAIAVKVLWKSPLWRDVEGAEKPIVEEHSVIRVYEATESHRTIDFDIRLRALEENVRLGGSTNNKGYGGFSTRIPLPENLQIVGPDGPVAVDLTRPSSPLPWVDFSADFSGNGKVSGLAVMCAPSNPGFPQGWTIRKKNSCQNPVFPGKDPVLLPTDQPLVLRYRIVLHHGNSRDADVARLFQNYSVMNPQIR